MNNSIVTVDLGEFGNRELSIAAQLLTELSNNNCPEDFDRSEVTINFNKYSGNVFLSNSDYQVAMMNGDTLESFYTSPYHGVEGFWDELVEQFDDLCSEDQDWMRDIANGRELPELTEDKESELELPIA